MSTQNNLQEYIKECTLDADRAAKLKILMNYPEWKVIMDDGLFTGFALKAVYAIHTDTINATRHIEALSVVKEYLNNIMVLGAESQTNIANALDELRTLEHTERYNNG